MAQFAPHSRLASHPNRKSSKFMNQLYEDLKKIEDPKEREILSWVWINFQYFKKGELSKQDFKETILLGIEDILSR